MRLSEHELSSNGHHNDAADSGLPSVAPARQPECDAPGQPQCVADDGGLLNAARASQPDGDAAGHMRSAANSSPMAAARPSPPDVTETVEAIRYWHRQRVYAMEQRKRADLSLGAFLRTVLGWRKDMPEADRKRIAKQAADLVAIGEKDAKGKPADVDEPTYAEWRDLILASIQARAPFNAIEKSATKQMERLAKSLPVWAWVSLVEDDGHRPRRGFGAISLAVIVAEAGDLSLYATHSKLWKRMGVAVIDGVRQGSPGKGASADDWIVHGYSPARRSRLFVIGDSLIKGNQDGAYRTAYLARKAYEVARDPEMRPIHAHRRAQRFMEKRLLKHLWHAWRRASERLPKRAMISLPAADQLAA